MRPRALQELDEPVTFWSIISRFTGGLIVIFGIGCLAVPFFPKLKAFRELNEEGKIIEARRAELALELEEKREELRMTQTDPQFIELQARDHLDLYREGEVVFRFEDRR